MLITRYDDFRMRTLCRSQDNIVVGIRRNDA